MFKKQLMFAGAAAALLASTQVYAQNADMTGVDAACVIQNADGTQSVDMTKCPDGKTAAAVTPDTAPAADTNAAAQPSTDATQATASTTAPQMDVIVPMDILNTATVMSANDFIGKTVYDIGGNNIGEVNDLVMSKDGKIQATILGVGGFLGIGEKNVAVPVTSIEVVPDGDAVRLVVKASKEQLEAAPSYDLKTRRYAG
jgi:sporulation protein YlmC with PRC-barrel domain